MLPRLPLSLLTITGALTILPALAQADVVKCSAPDGSLTYTDGRCSGALMVGRMPSNRSSFAPPPVHSTQWAEKIAPRQVRTDVESVKSAYDAIKMRENGARMAEFTTD
ncbi:MAG TPA: hypothetical protein VF433_03045 [Cellvibrio sp.]|uniref:DUF4124 domain-containing protein n=1 Tax=Oxalicibacterium faecigallinarum TaxID=573741 RepID=A0A8J3AWR8_9BURK|nr:hypothetical protein [Oxalicibacterium faecigallinarum]MDQ7968410.1 hypothetical protein [Oxalicibacterium faecigallinarum]GGI17658.1 hypothetical protein GCM10008066_10080 [Oxalicibacterium faecigallinarum]